MLLQQLIQQPITSSKLVVFDPFRMPEPAELVKEVIGLANADVEGPRYILFGVNPGAIDGSKVVGIKEDAAAALKKAHRVISAHIEPVVSLAFIFDKFNGKLAGALEIDGAGDGPFVPGEAFAADDTGTKTWVREGRELRVVDISEIGAANDDEAAGECPEEPEPEPIEIPPIDVGFNEEPDCAEIELAIPDTSNPPFADEKKDAGSETSLTETLKSAVNTMTTKLVALARSGSKGDDDDSSTDVVKAAQDLITAAENHYYFEERALHLNFSVRNTGDHPVDDMHIEFGFPTIEDFEIADRIHVSPFDKSSNAVNRNKDYPEVRRIDKGTLVRNRIGVLQPGAPTPALRCPVRMAVGPGAQMRKIAILYTLKRGEEVVGEGRLKIRFGKVLS
jgi:hypothetical protein